MWLGGDDVYDDDDAQNKEERRRESRPANWEQAGRCTFQSAGGRGFRRRGEMLLATSFCACRVTNCFANFPRAATSLRKRREHSKHIAPFRNSRKKKIFIADLVPSRVRRRLRGLRFPFSFKAVFAGTGRDEEKNKKFFLSPASLE